MLLDNCSCPKCANSLTIGEALSFSRKSDRLEETAIVKCPKCGTEFELMAKQLPEKTDEEVPVEPPDEEATPTEETPTEETTPPEEEQKKESLKQTRVMVCSCGHSQLSLCGAKKVVCESCKCGMTPSKETVDKRLIECYKMIECGVSSEKALSLFLGESK